MKRRARFFRVTKEIDQSRSQHGIVCWFELCCPAEGSVCVFCVYCTAVTVVLLSMGNAALLFVPARSTPIHHKHDGHNLQFGHPACSRLPRYTCYRPMHIYIPQVQTNALMSAAEVAKGTRYTEALTTSWRPPKHYRDMTGEECDTLREKWSILVDVRWCSSRFVLFSSCSSSLFVARPRARGREEGSILW